MRNRTLTKVLDKIFWFIILLLPLIIYIVDNFTVGMVRDYQFADQNIQTLSSVFYNYFGADGTGLVYEICGWLANNVYDQIGDIFRCEPLIYYTQYLVQVEILHFIVDILLFIFKYARSLLDRWGCVDG